ncbi:hypothetical protein [Mesorhizobium sp. M7A.F.Ca.US.010.02.1.1]|uniref:hypothetical protein n=1 Tax=Mesorhizobium sp. M7A.F.Ca.US.010.02.1.1 TaxID=2496743 RepID=UPI000FD513B4|nr:hypothetical protein [Mesorhizobium sp. M7A.F.Ca.US.010.02.1.1]RUW92061.1 hypothetical protein EOA19_11825 [Mesorhizobium sp. M7A.F.Ca.US.010.02.1.1]
MPNTLVPAAGEAMPAAFPGRFSRRAALGAIASLPVVGGAAAANAALAKHTPVDRFQAAVAELKAAAEALDPDIYNWTVNTNGDKQCGVLIAAFRTTTKYEGDGWYASPYEWGDVTQIFVRRAPEHDRKGERWFRVGPSATSNHKSVLMTEERFRVNYGPKVQA